MDAPMNHPRSAIKTFGTAVFILKCIFLGTRFDQGFALDNEYCEALKKTIEAFQDRVLIEMDGNFGQATRQKFFVNFGIDLDAIPHSVLRLPDVALQPNGELIIWPPGQIINSSKETKTSGGLYKILPPYMDYEGVHVGAAGKTSGPSVFVVKCLLIGTEYYKGYLLDTTFCDGLAKTISAFQKHSGIDADGCFGQGTRACFRKITGRNLEEVPRQVLAQTDLAIQPDGYVITWPPKLVLA